MNERYRKLSPELRTEVDKWINRLASHQTSKAHTEQTLRSMRQVGALPRGVIPWWRRQLSLIRQNGERFIYYEQRRRSQREGFYCSRCANLEYGPFHFIKVWRRHG